MASAHVASSMKNRNLLTIALITVADLKYLPESEQAQLEQRAAEFESELLDLIKDFSKRYQHLEIDIHFPVS